MCGKNLILIITSLTLLACAEPKYLTTNSQPNADQKQKSQSDCRIKFQNSDFCLTWTWEKYPTETEPGSFIFRTFKINSFDQFPVLTDMPLEPSVLLWMPSMGHGSTPVAVTRLGTGSFHASKVFFIMAGEWDIKFQLRDGDKILDEASDAISF